MMARADRLIREAEGRYERSKAHELQGKGNATGKLVEGELPDDAAERKALMDQALANRRKERLKYMTHDELIDDAAQFRGDIAALAWPPRRTAAHAPPVAISRRLALPQVRIDGSSRRPPPRGAALRIEGSPERSAARLGSPFRTEMRCLIAQNLQGRRTKLTDREGTFGDVRWAAETSTLAP